QCSLLLCCQIHSDAFGLAVDVRQTPAEVLIPPGNQVHLLCNHDKTDFYLMLWYQQTPGTADMKLIGYLYYSQVTMEKEFKDDFKISGDLSGTTAKNGSLVITKAEEKNSAVYFCAASSYEAYFGEGTRLTVLDPTLKVTPPTVRVLEPSENEHKNQQKTLVCVASDFYPDHVSVSWTINDESVTEGVATDGDAVRNSSKGFYRITSRLTVPSNTWFSKSKFSCTVSFFDGTKTTDHPETITSKEKGEFLSSKAGVPKLRPAGRIRPSSTFVIKMIIFLLYTSQKQPSEI
uniref:Ig-like domain-containing protein n=1 Tax=Oryzias melastigma TaxID=30732 RepID=A0A3B3CPJ3_ORYME